MHQDTLNVSFTFTFAFTLQEEIKVQVFIADFNDKMLISNFVKIGPAVLELKRGR
jgi:uncharacterized membrane protein